MDVDVTLFPRVALDNVGIAPLTSMFLFDESERTRIDDFRDEVHDSDGLQIVMASGERVWRPLRNPTQLQVSSFTSEAPRSFGLIQRSRRASDYHDLEAHYEHAPERLDRADERVGRRRRAAGRDPDRQRDQRQHRGVLAPEAGDPGRQALAHLVSPALEHAAEAHAGARQGDATRTGPSFDGKRRIFVVEFTGTGRTIEGLKLDAGTSAGKLSNLVLQPNPLTKGVRASFELDPGDADVAELRLRLIATPVDPVSETWLYRWTAS